MARFALIKGGVVENVIAADLPFVENADPAWLARYDAIKEVVTPDEQPVTAGALVTREAQPGSTVVGKVVTRAAPPAVAPVDPVVEKLAALEARLAAVETAKVVR